jgi:hypothetical protein
VAPGKREEENVDPVFGLSGVALAVCLVAIVVGNVLNYRSMKAGTGPSRTGTRIVLLVLGVPLVAWAVVFVAVTAWRGFWLLLPLALPGAVFGGWMVAAAIRRR